MSAFAHKKDGRLNTSESQAKKWREFWQILLWMRNIPALVGIGLMLMGIVIVVMPLTYSGTFSDVGGAIAVAARIFLAVITVVPGGLILLLWGLSRSRNRVIAISSAVVSLILAIALVTLVIADNAALNGDLDPMLIFLGILQAGCLFCISVCIAIRYWLKKE